VQASATGAQDTGHATAYARFRAAVAQAQFEQWLAGFAPRRATLIDISGPAAGAQAAAMAAAAGHTVLRVAPPGTIAPPGTLAAPGTLAPPETPAAGIPGSRLRSVTADGYGLGFLADRCADALIAEDRTLSRNLAAETLVAEIARVLRPGGRVFASVDSLTLGMAVLARQNHWPHLVDLPHQDVILVPWPDGTITRCYGGEHIGELFTGAGFRVCWIRPRTVFAPTTVSYLLDRDPGSFQQLLSAELQARGDDSVGDQLIVSAIREEPRAPHG
jgi:hypothetical protein